MNFGRARDFELLSSLNITCKGKILIARYGKNFRGNKVFNINSIPNFYQSSICVHKNISPLHEKAETFFSHTESTLFVRHSSEYGTSVTTDISYSNECRTKKVLSVCEKNASAFSCNSEILQYQQIIHKNGYILTIDRPLFNQIYTDRIFHNKYGQSLS